MDELHTLKMISKTLNTGNDLPEMLTSVLKALIDVTEFESGWIFFLLMNGMSIRSLLPTGFHLPHV